jgi:hypothetical protein
LASAIRAVGCLKNWNGVVCRERKSLKVSFEEPMGDVPDVIKILSVDDHPLLRERIAALVETVGSSPSWSEAGLLC